MLVLVILYALMGLTSGQEPTLTLSCPGTIGKLSPVTITTTTILSISKTSGVGTLCTLTLEVNNGLFIPIARSYDGNDWERAGGTFASSLEEWVCDGNTCSARVPPGDKYVLQTRSTSITSNFQAQIARFLEAATFGAKPSDLSSWGGITFAQFVKNQITIPLTSHREVFRRNTNARRFFDQPEFPANLNPCAFNSTWRRQVLSTLDRKKTLNIKKIGDRWEIKIDNHVRTMVQQLRFINAFKWQNDTISDGGTYPVCSTEEQLRRGIFNVRVNSNCRPLIASDLVVAFPEGFTPASVIQGLIPALGETAKWKKISENNMEYMFQGSIVTYPTSSITSITTVQNLKVTPNSSSKSFFSRFCEKTSFLFFRKLFCPKQTPPAPVPTPSPPTPSPPSPSVPSTPSNPTPNLNCNVVPVSSSIGTPIFAKTLDGIWLQFDPRIDMQENTLKSPLPDGGLSLLETKKTLYCSNAARTFFNEQSCIMSLRPACLPGSTNATFLGTASTGIIVCGSLGEISNDVSLGDKWLDASSVDSLVSQATGLPEDTTTLESFSRQREFIWSDVALNSNDQLRQRIAFSLMHIFSLPKLAIQGEFHSTEIFLQYYDIFVRNSFGNYGDVLREVSYNALNAESLSYIDSRSVGSAFQGTGAIVYPDENYARELMQLFTIGLLKLNIDGSMAMEFNNTIDSYTSDDILSFARVWTAFRRNSKRANVESISSHNRYDPLRIDAERRDRFPKSDLARGYIGDYYPLCKDLPSKSFLRIGAKYRLLGSSFSPELVKETWVATSSTRRLVLQSNSNLHKKLCNASPSGNCTFPAVVTLDSNVDCTGIECNLDTIRVLQIGSVFYEYIRLPCVEQPFFLNGIKTAGVGRDSKPVCANPLLPVAAEACCLPNITQSWKRYAVPACLISGERMTQNTAKSRCASIGREVCDYHNVTATLMCPFAGFYWTSQSCDMRVKVASDGQAAVVHDYTFTSNDLRKNTPNFFKVYWEGDIYPTVESGCNGGQCEIFENSCICNVTVSDEPVFLTSPQNTIEILEKLRIGHSNPAIYDSSKFTKIVGNGYNSYSTTQSCCDNDTVFEVRDRNGQTKFLRNMKSTVSIDGTNFKFRNPPQFNSIMYSEYTITDAHYETEAAINHLLYHENTPPFIAYRYIQRFGVSNPTPRYVKAVATAFKTGSYSDGDVNFGKGIYGDLEATIAAVLLDREARSLVLDKDPAQGALREPILKVLSFMRATHFKSSVPLLELDYMDEKVGQMAYEQKSVFSFFKPEFSPSELSGTGLTSPESEILSASSIIGLLNGLFSLIKYGLSECNGGFGAYGDCSSSSGNITYIPSNIHTPSEMVRDLSHLLTSGRLSDAKQQVITNEIANQTNSTKAYQEALQLIVSSPEFHSTSSADLLPIEKPPQIPTSSNPPEPGYKAVIHLSLRGGCDSFNVLVPDQICSPLHQEYVETRGDIGLKPSETIPLTGNAGGSQPCGSFTVHSALPIIQSLYNNRDLLFMANVGVLTQYVNKTDYAYRTETPLFAHNSMQDEVNKLDPLKKIAGTGTLGRMADVLQKKGYMTGRTSVDAPTGNLASRSTSTPPVLTMSNKGVRLFNLDPSSTTMNSIIEQLNVGTSGIYGELWSTLMKRSINQTDELYGLLQAKQTTTTFPLTSLGSRFKIISQLIAGRVEREVERDFFFLPFDGFDTHNEVTESLNARFIELNEAMEDFVNELKILGIWDNVVIVQTSDFGRTITGNSGGGTDHGWGGNYWIAGGSVDGQKIVGKYPSTFSFENEYNIDRGRLIPTTSWDSVFNSIADWMGVTTNTEFNDILPNRNKFNDLFTRAQLFVS